MADPVTMDDVDSTSETTPVTVLVLSNDSDADGDSFQIRNVNVRGSGNVALGETVNGLTNNGSSITFDYSQYIDPVTGLHPDLAPGEERVILIDYNVIDENGEMSASYSTAYITVTGDAEGNADPVVTSGPGEASGSADEAISLDGIRGADQTVNNRLEPVINYDSDIVSLLAANPDDMPAVLAGLQALLPAGSGIAEAMAIVWDYVDDNFSYYNTVINEISARLSVEYALYLLDGGAPLTGTAAKYTPDGADLGTAPDRYQSLHDNILGNLNGAGLNDKLRGPPNGSNPTPDEEAYQQIIDLLAANDLSDLVNRPVYSGTEGTPNLSLAYDQANDLLPPGTGGTLTATDADGDDLTWSGSAQGTYGAFTIAPNGAWTYLLDQFDPDTQALGAGETAVDTFTATVTDENGGTATQLVTIDVTGTNDAPVGAANAVLADGDEDVVYHVTSAELLAGFSDVDGDSLSVTGLTADNGTVVAEPGGFAITPDANYNGPMVLSYQVDDGNGGSTSATQTFAVASANDAPAVTGPVLESATEGGGLYTFDPLANSSDAEGDGLVVIPTGVVPAGVSFVGASAETIDFSDYNLGSVVGQEGWTDATPSSPDNEIVDVDGNRMLRLANDPTSGDFGGPFSPAFAISAGEAAAAADTLTFSFLVKAVNAVADGSRIEIDLGSSDRDDRYNFMALEYVEGGLRLVQNTPLADGVNWESNNFDFGTGSVQLGALLDASVAHTIQVIFRAVDGSNNDIVEYYVDGVLVGTGSTFENFAEFHLAQPHASAINSVNNVLFRAGNPAGNPFPADGAGGNRQGFYFDDLTMSAYDSHQLQFNADDPAYNDLAAGQTEDVTINYNVADGHGGVTPASMVITVTGTNDAPTTNDDVDSTTENLAVVISPLANDTDPDAGDTLTISAANIRAGYAGSITYDGTTITYDPGTAFDYLAAGDTAEVLIDYRAQDSSGAEPNQNPPYSTITVTITGTNDAAVITGATTGAADETDAPVTITGDLDADDVDGADTFVAQTGTAGTYGSFSIDENGEWSYTASSAHDELAVGDSYEDTFEVEASDGTTQDVTVTINGTNDAAVITGATSGAADETDAPVTITGDLDADDVDGADTFVAQTGTAGTYGTFSIDENGEWSYTASAAYDELAVGDSYEDTFEVATADGTTQNVTVTINGTNDAAVITGATSGAADETDAPVTITGDLDANDVDGDDTFVAQTGTAGTYGSFSIDENGAWSYTASSAHDELAEGDTYEDTFEVATADGTTQDVTVTITGTNDAAVITGDTTGAADETDVPVVITGDLNADDIDGADTFVEQTDVAGTYGTFSIDETGEWTYTASAAYDELAVGDSYEDTFEVETADGTTQDVTVTINGTNDAPTTVDDVDSTTENLAVVISPLANDTDPDDGDTLTISAANVRAGYPGSITYDATTITYDPGTAFDYLAAGETAEVLIDYRAQDESGAEPNQNPPYSTITLTVTGTNDAAVITGDTTGAADETDAPVTITGDLDADDVDGDDTFVAQTDTAGTYGTFSIDETGAWTYTASSAHDELAEGETYEDTFEVETADGTTQDVTVTITGTNDAAVITGDTSGAADETDAPVTITGDLDADDADGDDTFVAQTDTAGTYGTFSIDENGEWTYTASAAYDELAVGDSYEDTFEVATADGTTQNVTVTINGTNDAPVAVDDILAAPDGPATTFAASDLLANDTDADNPNSELTIASVTSGTGGTATLNGDGTVTFTPAAGFSGPATFTYTTSDGSATSAPATVTVNVTSTNDIIVGTPDPDTLNGYGGKDRIFGRASNDVIDGGSGDDQLYGETGNDTIRGGTGDDVVDGGEGNDTLMMDDGGDDTALGGAGSDIIYYGDELTTGDVNDAGAGRDVVVLQGNYNLVLGAANLLNTEFLSLQTGTNPEFGQSGGNSYDYDITTVDENVDAGQLLTVNGQSLQAGEDLIFDGSAESDGKFLVYASRGMNDLTGGAGNDIFFFEGGRLDGDDVLDGGGGIDALVIRGTSGDNVIVLGENQLTSIESVSFNPKFASDQSIIPASYDLTLAQGNIPEGGTLIVNGSALIDGQSLTVDGSAVTDGKLRMFGGAGDDDFTGGEGDDMLNGAGGADRLTGGDGADTFRYASVTDSVVGDADQILDFTPGTDKIDLSAIDAISSTPENDAFTFSEDGTFHQIAGELRSYDSGNGSWFVEGDTNGDGSADFQIEVFTTNAEPLIATDFVP
jgi:VCBS repeat-containing protein